MMDFLNTNKREVYIALTVIVILMMFLFPLADVSLSDGTKATGKINFSALDLSGKLEKIKDSIGVGDVSLSGIDAHNPKDDMEKAIIILAGASNRMDLAVLSLIASLLFLIVGAFTVYIKPNSIRGTVITAISALFVFLAFILSSVTVNQLNKSIDLLKSYCGVQSSVTGLELIKKPAFYAVMTLLITIVIQTIVFRKPKPSDNEAEKATKGVLFFCAAISVISVLCITGFMLFKGVPTIAKIGLFNFVFGVKWDPVGNMPSFGIGYMILTSFAGTLGAVLIGVPLGILVAIYISKLTHPKVGMVLGEAVNLLAGIPSVIYGAVGALLLVPFIQKLFDLPTGSTLLAAIIVLSIMVLPTIISVTSTSLKAVPETYMEASLALGLTREASILKILVPAARSGIMTGVLLGLGRALGEAMAIILVAGNVTGFPELLNPARFLTTGIVAEMGYAEGLHRDALFAIGLVLFLFILVINGIFRFLIKKVGKKYE